MDIFDKIKPQVLKLQALPEGRKKVIVLSIAIVLGLILLIFWLKTTIYRFDKMGENIGKIQLPPVNMLETPGLEQKLSDIEEQASKQIEAEKQLENKKP